MTEGVAPSVTCKYPATERLNAAVAFLFGPASALCSGTGSFWLHGAIIVARSRSRGFFVAASCQKQESCWQQHESHRAEACTIHQRFLPRLSGQSHSSACRHSHHHRSVDSARSCGRSTWHGYRGRCAYHRHGGILPTRSPSSYRSPRSG